MPSFRYKAIAASGEFLAGTVEASSDMAAVRHLQSLGHYPISTADADGGGGRWAWLGREVWPARRVSQRVLSQVTQELAALLDAGLPLDRALGVLIELGETGRLKGPLAEALGRIRGGSSLTEAISGNGIFSRFYVSMVHAGEIGGNLPATLRRLADYLARTQAVKDTVASALTYPAIVLVTAGLAITFILVFVLPEFEPLFHNAGKSLPFATRVVVGLGEAVRDGWWIGLAVCLAAISGLRTALGRPGFRLKWDAAMLRAPLFGPLAVKIEMERFSRTLGVLTGSGMPLPDAMKATGDTLGNSAIAQAVRDIAAGLREGEGLHARLARTDVFPADAFDLVRIGEEIGKLDEMLLRQADIYERSVRLTVERMMALLVPGITICLGIVVAGLVASILVAVLGVAELAM